MTTTQLLNAMRPYTSQEARPAADESNADFFARCLAKNDTMKAARSEYNHRIADEMTGRIPTNWTIDPLR